MGHTTPIHIRSRSPPRPLARSSRVCNSGTAGVGAMRTRWTDIIAHEIRNSRMSFGSLVSRKPARLTAISAVSTSQLYTSSHLHEQCHGGTSLPQAEDG